MTAASMKGLSQQGYSLIEILIVLLVSAMVLLSLMSVFATGFTNNIKMYNRQLLSQDMKNIVSVIQREIPRAGYIYLPQDHDLDKGYSLTKEHSPENENSAVDSGNPFLIEGELYQLNAQRSCITYRYDRDKNGELNNEFFGFRLSNGKVQQRKGGDVDCEAGLGWEVISDDNSIWVTGLSFTPTEVIDPVKNTARTLLLIELSAQHKQVEQLTLSFSRHVLTRAREL